eukprot:Nk52_evm35s1129 gene=Nk52_evmTU35s1129
MAEESGDQWEEPSSPPPSPSSYGRRRRSSNHAGDSSTARSSSRRSTLRDEFLTMSREDSGDRVGDAAPVYENFPSRKGNQRRRRSSKKPLVDNDALEQSEASGIEPLPPPKSYRRRRKSLEPGSEANNSEDEIIPTEEVENNRVGDDEIPEYDRIKFVAEDEEEPTQVGPKGRGAKRSDSKLAKALERATSPVKMAVSKIGNAIPTHAFRPKRQQIVKMDSNEDIHIHRESAFYRFADPIQNFRVEVTLKKVTSSHAVLSVEDRQKQKLINEGAEIEIPLDADGNAIPIVHEAPPEHKKTYAWQERVFSAREVNKYRNKGHCSSALDHMYYQRLNSESEKNNAGSILFSHVDNDEYIDESQLLRRGDTSKDELPLITINNMLKARSKTDKGRDSSGNTAVNPVRVFDQEKHCTHALETPFQWMHIMADLGQGAQPHGENDEYVLCSIKVDNNGVLEIKPDFTNDKEPYRLESKDHYVFEYTINHVSPPMNFENEKRERLMMNTLYQKHQDILKTRVGDDFAPPPPESILKLMLYGEIVSATGFPNDDIYVHYMLDLEDGWQVSSTNIISAFTQISRGTNDGQEDRTAHFAHPFEFELHHNATSTISPRPKIYFEVGSIDFFDRHRVEGYGNINIPLDPGVTSKSIKTWRPVGDLNSQMRRMFIGGDAQLSDVTFASIPSTFDGTVLGKYGFRTIPSGEVQIRINCITQSFEAVQESAVLASPEKKKTVNRDISKLLSTNAILEDFQRARQRMQSIRKSIIAGYSN